MCFNCRYKVKLVPGTTKRGKGTLLPVDFSKFGLRATCFVNYSILLHVLTDIFAPSVKYLLTLVCLALCLWHSIHFWFGYDSHHTHTHPFNGSFSGTTRMSRYQKGKNNLDFAEARDSEWQWHPLGHMQVCTSLQSDNHTSTPPLIFFQAGCPSCCPTNSVKALKAMLKVWCYTIWQSPIERYFENQI